MKFETRAIRIQTDRTDQKEHSTPIFPTSSFVFDDAQQMRAVFAGEEQGNIYSRFSNPNLNEFADKIASLEDCEAAVSTSTGMAAVFCSFMSFLKSGDHIVSSRAIFGSTFQVIGQTLPEYGISYDFVDASQPSLWEKSFKANTKIFYLETPSNPALEILDIEYASTICKKHGVLLMVDNCFATPYLQNPAKLGADLVIHSATKFIDGQGRVLGGAVAGSKEHIQLIYNFIRRTGATLSPFNAWVLSKSLETLAVRMDRHCQNAAQLADWLAEHPRVLKVNYPFRKDHPQYELAKKQMSQGGGIVTFLLNGDIEEGQQFLNKLNILSLTANLGDSRSIASHPASTTHAKVPESDRALMGIQNNLIRISVGLEHIDDIIADIDQALS